MASLRALVLSILVTVLMGGLTFPALGQDVNPPIVPEIRVPQESPDRQRFRPETPGQIIKQNREQVEQYKAVPPPTEPTSQEVKPSQEGAEKAK